MPKSKIPKNRKPTTTVQKVVRSRVTKNAPSRKGHQNVGVALKKPKQTAPSVKQSKNKTGSEDIRYKDMTTPSSMMEDILGTVGDVVSTGSRLLAGDPTALLKVPNTVLKVLDTATGVTDALTSGNVPSVVPEKIPQDINEKQNKLVVNELSKTMPVVNTSSIPSVFGADIKTPPLERTDYMMDGRKVSKFTGGVVMSTNILFDPTSSTNLFIPSQSLMSPIDLSSFGSRISQIADTFQKWRLLRGNFQYIPNVGTNTQGTVALTVLDGVYAPPFPISGGLSAVSQREWFKQTACYLGTSLSFPGTGWLWCTRSYTTTDSIRWYAQQNYQFFTIGNNQTVVSGPVGYVLFTFEIEFSSPAEAPYSYINNFTGRSWFLSYFGYDYMDCLKLSQKLLKFFEEFLISRSKTKSLLMLEVPFDSSVRIFKDRTWRNINKYRLMNFLEAALNEYLIYLKSDGSKPSTKFCNRLSNEKRVFTPDLYLKILKTIVNVFTSDNLDVFLFSHHNFNGVISESISFVRFICDVFNCQEEFLTPTFVNVDELCISDSDSDISSFEDLVLENDHERPLE